MSRAPINAVEAADNTIIAEVTNEENAGPVAAKKGRSTTAAVPNSDDPAVGRKRAKSQGKKSVPG